MTSAREDRLRILVWPVHASWTGAFVCGRHEYLIPASHESEPVLPPAARRVTPEELGDGVDGVDVVVLQGPEELDLFTRWTGLRAGRDVPAVYVEHEPPTGDVPRTRHLLAAQTEIPLVHVTHFNRLMWDSGRAPSLVIEHGVPDPGLRYTGEERRAGVVYDGPGWGRAAGTDLLTTFAEAVPVDVYGTGAKRLATRGGRICPIGDLGREERVKNLARRRMYLHTARWTSLGSPLIEAMMLGMPVVAVAGTEVPRAIPPEAGFVSADLDELTGAIRVLLTEPDLAHRMGKFAREFALANYGLEAFLYRWDAVLRRVRGGDG
ncbi:MAG TPA: glycosyltransferase [Amycolatopsis sp.]|jgi:hypothetical protein|nr:glycosyltransferase [Amycolatopsis sp.]